MIDRTLRQYLQYILLSSSLYPFGVAVYTFPVQAKPDGALQIRELWLGVVNRYK